jgi:hypothetical protein
MARSIQFTCDRCGAVRGNANHWFSVLRKPGLIQIFYSQAPLEVPDAVHLCGERCLQVRIAELIAQPAAIELVESCK